MAHSATMLLEKPVLAFKVPFTYRLPRVQQRSAFTVALPFEFLCAVIRSHSVLLFEVPCAAIWGPTLRCHSRSLGTKSRTKIHPVQYPALVNTKQFMQYHAIWEESVTPVCIFLYLKQLVNPSQKGEGLKVGVCYALIYQQEKGGA